MNATAEVQVPLTPKEPVPEHVPEHLVYDFDLFADANFLRNPHDCLLQMLETHPPVFWTPRYGGHWVFLSYEAVFNAARDYETFSNEIVPSDVMDSLMIDAPADAPRIPRLAPIYFDPPEHGKYRAPLQKVFSPKTINSMENNIRSLAVELIDALAANDHCEFMQAVAEPLPVKIFLSMFGLPVERMPEYREMVKIQLAGPSIGGDKILANIIKTSEIMREAALARQYDRRDDIISMLWDIEIDGKPATVENVEDYGTLLFVAGLDTVVNAMGLGVGHLARDQELQARLRSQPELLPDAVEELLRRYSFVIPYRRVIKDTVYYDAPLKKQDRVLLFLPSADLDSREFPDAEKFDLHREKKSHIVFNAGPHRCLGSHLARLELRIMYEELLARIPQFRIDEAQPATYRCGHVLGFEKLNLRWD